MSLACGRYGFSDGFSDGFGDGFGDGGSDVEGDAFDGGCEGDAFDGFAWSVGSACACGFGCGFGFRCGSGRCGSVGLDEIVIESGEHVAVHGVSGVWGVVISEDTGNRMMGVVRV